MLKVSLSTLNVLKSSLKFSDASAALVQISLIILDEGLKAEHVSLIDLGHLGMNKRLDIGIFLVLS
jgi:hypothetical protein